MDKSRLKRTVYGGLLAFGLGTIVDWAGHQLNLYQFHSNIINWMGNSLFYAAGPLFTMGTLFFQYLSLDRRLQAANIIAFTLAYFCVELLIIGAGGATYINWHFMASLVVDILVLTSMSYIGEIVVFRKTGKQERLFLYEE
ncbi:MAG: hypothetical protein ACOY46_10610 [Bacillota bacterium]